MAKLIITIDENEIKKELFFLNDSLYSLENHKQHNKIRPSLSEQVSQWYSIDNNFLKHLESINLNEIVKGLLELDNMEKQMLRR